MVRPHQIVREKYGDGIVKSTRKTKEKPAGKQALRTYAEGSKGSWLPLKIKENRENKQSNFPRRGQVNAKHTY